MTIAATIPNNTLIGELGDFDINNMTVVKVPGPANKGKARGVIATSRPSVEYYERRFHPYHSLTDRKDNATL